MILQNGLAGREVGRPSIFIYLMNALSTAIFSYKKPHSQSQDVVVHSCHQDHTLQDNPWDAPIDANGLSF